MSRPLLGALALVALLASSAPAEAPMDPAPVRVLVELRLGHLTSRTVPGFRAGDEALIPVGALLELAEVRHHLDATGRLTATLPEQHEAIVIDQAGNTMWAGNRRIILDVPHSILHDGDLYVASRALGDLLDVHFSVSWPDLTVTLDDPDHLPIARRLAREAARQRLLAHARSASRAPDLTLDLARPDWDGLVLDYSLVAPSDDPLHQGSYDVALGANLFGGSFEGSVSSAATSSRTALSWTGVWNDASIVRQLRLGDALATGPSPRPLRGVSIGNAPYLRLTDFGTADFLGDVAPGWLVEAYRGGELLAFDSTNTVGRFGMRLPVEYGENPIDFVAYGPYGETHELHQLYRIPGQLIPAKRLEYGASLGACTLLRCTATANIDVRYGLSSRWTARAGLDRFWRDSLGDLLHPYASVVGALGNAWSVDLFGVADATAQATVRFEPSLGLRLMAQYARYTTGVAEPLLSPAGQRSRWAATALVRPLGIRKLFYLDAQAERIEMTTGTLTRARLGSSVQRGALRLMPYARVEREVAPGGTALTQPFIGMNALLLPLGRRGSIFGDTWWRAGIETAGLSRLNRISAVVTSPVGHGVRAELGAMWTRGMQAPAFTLSFTADRGSVRSYTTLSTRRGATPGLTQSLQGSMLVDRATKQVMFVSGPSMQRAGVAGRVFLDANGNGLRDPDESPLGDVRIRVGTRTVRSDADGWFRAWDVVPFEPVTIVVDSMSLASPLWVPLFGVTSVVPGPNRFQLVDVPIVPGGTVDGQVLLETGALPSRRGGIHVALTNLRTRDNRAAITFSDGAFSFLAVAPGRYRVAVEERDLADLHGVAREIEVTVPPDVNGARITGVALTVRSVVAVR